MRRDRAKNYVHNIPAARSLRRPMTATETALWGRLRDRRLDGLKFRRQHAIGRFVVDFYSVEARLAIEVDGGVHDDPEQKLHDAERQALIEDQGIRFIRFSTAEVESSIDSVCHRIVIAARIDSPLSREVGRGG